MLASRRIGSTSYPFISKDYERLKGRVAWTTNLHLAGLAGSKVASCLGPKGAYKMVAYHRGPELVVKVTKDAVDIVEELRVEYPAIKTLALAAKIQRDYIGDGVSTVIVLISALLEEAEKLIQLGVHPVAILNGFEKAAKNCVAKIDELARDFEYDLDGALLEVLDSGRGILGKNLRRDISHLMSQRGQDGQVDITRIKLEKKRGGSLDDSRVIRGVVIKKEKAHMSMPDEIDAPRIALVTKKLELKQLELKMRQEGHPETLLNITEPGQILAFKVEEDKLRAAIAESVKASGANVVFCGFKIHPGIADRLSRDGIFAIASVDYQDMEEVAKVTGARIVGDASLLEKDDLGKAEKLEVDKILPEKIAILHSNQAATVLLRGSSSETLEELEKVVRKALLVLKFARDHAKVVPGGGAIFMSLALSLREFALTFSGREQLAIDAFADAIERIPRLLAINGGHDPINVITDLRAAHARRLNSMGVGDEGVVDMWNSRIVELAWINKEVVLRALEVASLLLRIDDYFYTKKRPVFHK